MGRVNRDAVADLVLTRLGARRSAWNGADIHGEAEKIIAGLDIIAAVPGAARAGRGPGRPHPHPVRAPPGPRRCPRARPGPDLGAGAAASRPTWSPAWPPGPSTPPSPTRSATGSGIGCWTPAQRRVVAALTGTARLLVIEGAAGAGKTTTLAAAADLLDRQRRRMIVVTPTLKAAQVAQAETGTDAYSAAWLIHHHGYRWDTDGHHWQVRTGQLDPLARLLPATCSSSTRPACSTRTPPAPSSRSPTEPPPGSPWSATATSCPPSAAAASSTTPPAGAPPDAHHLLDGIHRFTDPALRRTSPCSCAPATDPAQVFDALVERGQVVIHPSDIERTAALAAVDGLVIADTREQVATLNAAIRDHRHTTRPTGAAAPGPAVTTGAGESLSVGDLVATRRNDPHLDVANRDRWTITAARPRRRPHRHRTPRHPRAARRLRPRLCRARLRHHRPRRPRRHRRPPPTSSSARPPAPPPPTSP